MKRGNSLAFIPCTKPLATSFVKGWKAFGKRGFLTKKIPSRAKVAFPYLEVRITLQFPYFPTNTGLSIISGELSEVLCNTPLGLYCQAGDFYVDPKGSVERALVTHAHSDHARSGHESYLCSSPCLPLLQLRLGKKARIENIPFGEKRKIGKAQVSFHPAGHILGSAQVRVEVAGRVFVASGDYKPDNDRTCEEFEVVKCDRFISECTFGLPVYRWKSEESVFEEMNRWWHENTLEGKPSLIFAYSLGKAQRVLSGLDPQIGPIHLHPAAYSFLEHYRAAGVSLPRARKIVKGESIDHSRSVIIAPPAVEDSGWTKSFKGCKKSMASGWMTIRGPRRRQNLDQGFVLSDHADWNGLLRVIKETGAESVRLTHGNGDALARYLCEMGIDGQTLENPSMAKGPEQGT